MSDDKNNPVSKDNPFPPTPLESGRPSLMMALTDFGRAAVEYGHYRLNRRKILADLPTGDGHPVLFLPGFATGDWAMKGMRDTFRALGYYVHGWRCGTNTGPSEALLKDLRKRFEDLCAKHEGKQISIVGWSLGGIYARELARAYPEKVRCVVTLGTPFGAGHHPDSVDAVVRRVFETLNPGSPFLTDQELQNQALNPPPTVPTTSIYSQGDGIVHWKTCINPKTRLSENIDITPANPIAAAHASHAGLTVNPVVMTILADRLKASGDRPWQKFDPAAHPSLEGALSATPGHDQYIPTGQRRSSPPRTLFPRQN